MTTSLTWLNQQRFSVAPMAAPLPVFVRDMPWPRSGTDAAHIGLAEMVAVLVPVLPGGTTLARVVLPSGAIRDVSMDAICPAKNVQPIRLGPGIHGASPARVATHA